MNKGKNQDSQGNKKHRTASFSKLFTSIPSQCQSWLLQIFFTDSLLKVMNIVYSFCILQKNPKFSKPLIFNFFGFFKQHLTVKILCVVSCSVWSYKKFQCALLWRKLSFWVESCPHLNLPLSSFTFCWFLPEHPLAFLGSVLLEQCPRHKTGFQVYCSVEEQILMELDM